MKKVLMILLYSASLYAGVSFDSNKSIGKPAALAPVANANDISNISARLQVEGANVRKFNIAFFATGEGELQKKALSVVERDFLVTGAFNVMKETAKPSLELMKQKGAEGFTEVNLKLEGDRLDAIVSHAHLITGNKLSTKFSFSKEAFRKLAHKISQSIYEHYIGKENLFELKIAAIKRIGSESQVVLMDFDGGNEKVITTGSWQKSSPHFSPDGKRILYSVVTNEGQGIVEQYLSSTTYKFLTKEPGLNLDPSINSATGELYATLSFGKSANIYKMTAEGKSPKVVTDGLGVNLSPSINREGTKLAFVSDRSGNPQIYVQQLAGGKAERLTFNGKYNQTPHMNGDGTLVAFTGRDETFKFDIFLIDLNTARITRVTEKQGRNQEPHITPSGKHVIFASERDGKPQGIYISNLNGTEQFRLTESGFYLSPVMQTVAD